MLGFIVNCGSSSIKARLIDTDTQETLFEARAGHLKTTSSEVITKINGISYSLLDVDNASLTHEQALQLILNDLSTRKVIKKLEDISLNLNSSITFIIGGTLGLTKEIIDISNESICFSKMTFPHQLIRVFLLEQIFRSFKISKGETYHR